MKIDAHWKCKTQIMYCTSHILLHIQLADKQDNKKNFKMCQFQN